MVKDLIHQELEGVTPEGPFKAVGTADGMKAAVIAPRHNEDDEMYTVHRYRGETAWEDAVRQAGDLNARRRK